LKSVGNDFPSNFFHFSLLYPAYSVRFAKPENRRTLERVNGRILLNESKIFN
jgi:hypothetical protein